MKNISSAPKVSKSKSGFALIIILAAIVLLLALVIGFFSRVQGELQSSSTYQSAGSARNLSDYAVNMVLTQVKAATSGGNTIAWASQPGAIRTYDNSGGLVKVYKLYSSSKMFDTSINPTSELNAISSWSSNKALFTDLNEPINGQYPILDPSAQTVVQGFAITGAPTESGSNANPAPMPAQWLYVLKDGQVIVPGGSGNNASVASATVNNPIVGRVAFWTDDETSKININTAGGGQWTESNVSITAPMVGGNLTYSGPPFTSFSTTPVTYTAMDGAIAINQPGQYEYQRYPGHPATTFLSAALPNLNLQSIYDILPRLTNDRSSQGGTAKVSAPLEVDTDRLYQSVDELSFAKTRSPNSGVDRAALERAKFFLTANSRSPDVNMFNEPKIGLWPINGALSKRTPFDRVIEFCQKINGRNYYFERNDPNSPFTDINQTRNRQIMDYLRTRTSEAVPGFGGGSAGILGKFGAADRDQTLVEVFDYIRSTNPRDSSQSTTANNPAFYFSETGAVVPSYEASTQSQGFGRFPTVSKVGLLFYTVAVNQMGSDQSQITRTPAPPLNKIRIGMPEDDSQNVPTEGYARVRALLLIEMFIPGQGYDYVFPRCSIEISGLNTIKWSNNQSMFDKPSGVLNYNLPSLTEMEYIWQKGYNSNPWGGRLGIHNMISPFVGKGRLDRDILIPANYPFAGIGSATSPEIKCREDDPNNANFEFLSGALQITIKNQNDQVVQDFTVNIPGAKVPVPYLAPAISGRDFRKVADRMRQASESALYGLVKKEDSVRMVAPTSGDYRLIAARNKPSSTLFQPHAFYGEEKKAMAHSFMHSMATAVYGAGLGSYANNALAAATSANFDTTTTPVPTFIKNDATFTYGNAAFLVETANLAGVKAGSSTAPGDWDLGVGRTSDGPYINYPDEGNVGTVGNTRVPYFGNVDSRGQLGKANFSPNRMMSSAVMLGSLPSQAASEQAWQTLLFRPTDVQRPGAGLPLNGPPFTTAPDYLLLDFFNMPVVEPYAISEPLSTAGKVNMNYQILPYTYIERSTAVRAVLRSEQMLAVPNTDGLKYRDDGNKTVTYRSLLRLDQTEGTLKGFADRFAAGDIFRSPSEICSIWLVPQGQTYAGMPAFWNAHQFTADNGKEQSYARIYPRLTTKSNTFTVHYRVQTLKKPKSGTQTTWQDGVDKVQAEYRGSTTIERYIDPNDPNIPDYITTSSPALDSFYKIRILSQKQFNP